MEHERFVESAWLQELFEAETEIDSPDELEEKDYIGYRMLT